MNKIVMIAALFIATAGRAQQPSPAEELAAKIARKIKDTLSLTTEQQQLLYDINMQLHNRKMEARRQAGTPAASASQLQFIENQRDSLYKQVLPDAKFPLYLQKKKKLASNN